MISLTECIIPPDFTKTKRNIHCCFSFTDTVNAVLKSLGIVTWTPRSCGKARHVFTHQVGDMNLIFLLSEADSPAPKGYCWIPVPDIAKIALPSAMNAAVRALDE